MGKRMTLHKIPQLSQPDITTNILRSILSPYFLYNLAYKNEGVVI